MLVKILHMRQGQYIITTKKKEKGIYGSASKEEIKDLKEEGIDAEVIPWIEDKNN